MHQYLIDIIISYVLQKSIHAERGLYNDSLLKFLYEERIITLPCILKKYYEKNSYLFIEMCKRNDKENIKEYINKTFNQTIKITDIDVMNRVIYHDMIITFVHASPDLVEYFRSVYKECMENIN